MLRPLLAALFVTAAATAVAHADHSRAGTPGTVTAYELDARTVIDVKTCFRTTRFGGHDYARCGEWLRDSLKFQMCRDKGPGTHRYLYQVGDGRKNPSSVYCKK